MNYETEMLARHMVQLDRLLDNADQRMAYLAAVEIEDLRDHVQLVRSRLMRMHLHTLQAAWQRLERRAG